MDACSRAEESRHERLQAWLNGGMHEVRRKSDTPGSASDDRYKLRFGDSDLAETGVPLLDPFYSYLLVLSEGVSIVDLYPWLAQLMFHSVAVPSTRNDADANEAPKFKPINFVGFFIDDHQNSLAAAVSPEFIFTDPDPFLKFKENLRKKNLSRWGLEPRHFIVDTFGEFGDSRNGMVPWQELGAENNANGDFRKHLYRPLRVVGAGNPMQLMRRFTEIAEVPSNHFFRTPENYRGSEGATPSKPPLGVLNCFLINSISNLYRTMGFRDAMQFVRVLLKEGVWKPPPDSPEMGKPIKQRRLIDRDGLMFAILHEGVFSEAEIRYAETFFDGVIRFHVHWEQPEAEVEQRTDASCARKIVYFAERLPPGWLGSSEAPPTYPDPMQYQFVSGGGFNPERAKGFRRVSKNSAGLAPKTGQGK